MSIMSVPILVRGRHVMDSRLMPAEELQRRRDAMCALLAARELDGVICYADSSCNGYVEYFTNYNCATPFTNAILLLTADGHCCLIASVPPRDTQRMREGFIPDDVELLTVGMSPLACDHVGLRTVEHMREKGLCEKRWGGIGLDRCLKRAMDDLEAALPPIVDLTGEFERLRAIKSEPEIAIIRKATTIARDAALEALHACQSGADECTAAARAELLARRAGVEDVKLFIGTSKSGGYLRLPQPRRQRYGEIVKLFCQVQYLRYRGLFGTTTPIGGGPGPGPILIAEQLERFMLLLDEIKAGDPYDERLLGSKLYGHSAIHGLGQDLTEAPSAAVPLAAYEENMVLGVLLETEQVIMADTVLCTKTAARSLCS